MKKALLATGLLATGLLLITSRSALAHCQIPCGIYNDNIRIMMIDEHITTIEKSMRLITELSESPQDNMNQIVRWVNNKEQHADELTDIVTYYFLAQRIKVPESARGKEGQTYADQLAVLHQIMVAAMHAKQTTDHQYIEELRSLLKEFVNSYFDEEALEHLRQEHQHWEQ